jgi:hypothetical protein
MAKPVYVTVNQPADHGTVDQSVPIEIQAQASSPKRTAVAIQCHAFDSDPNGDPPVLELLSSTTLSPGEKLTLTYLANHDGLDPGERRLRILAWDKDKPPTKPDDVQTVILKITVT